MSYEIDSDERINTDLPARQAPSSFTQTMSSLPDPFSSAMNHVFFSGGDRRILLDEVIHLCQFGNNLVAAIGDDGVGKSAFLRQARFELSETAFCCLIDGDESMSPEDIFAQIISQLELPISSTSSVGEMIATLRHAMAEGSMHRVVVIIDNAHALADAILSALISLLQGHQGQYLHILMAGEKTLVDRLDRFEMVDVLVYDVTLNPFTLEETKGYLEFKLATAGYPDDHFLEDAQIESVWKESGGYAARIGRVAEQYIFHKELDIEDDVSTDRGLPLVHMALLVVLLAALILALIYMGGNEEGTVEGEKLVTQESIANQNQAPQSSVAQPEDQNTIGRPAGEVDTIQLPIALESPVSSSSQLAPDEVSRKSELVKQAKPLDQGQLNTGDSSTEALVVAQGGDSDPATTVGTQSQQVDAPNEVRPIQNKPTQKELDPSLKEELRKEVDSLKTGVTPTVDTSTQERTKETLAYTDDEKWLLSLGDSEFVLQVLAAGQKSSVQAFIRAQPNATDLRLIEVRRAAKPWYLVVVGNYRDNASARNAIQSLPQEQVNSGPWPRLALDLKREIRAFRNK